jgi:DNA-directed RNA polymerase specialized sigma24 family protein
MKIPKGSTKEEVCELINVVVNRIAPSYTFYGYEVSDIKQESWIICMKALDRYDGIRPLENFLSRNLANRLKTLIRDNHFNKDSSEDKKRVLMPGQLSNEESTHFYETFMLDDMDVGELVDIIDNEIPFKHRANYIKLINGNHIPKKEKEELIEIVQKIAHAYGFIN